MVVRIHNIRYAQDANLIIDCKYMHAKVHTIVSGRTSMSSELGGPELSGRITDDDELSPCCRNRPLAAQTACSKREGFTQFAFNSDTHGSRGNV